MASSVKVMESRFVQSCTSIANAPQILSAEIAILGRSNVGKSSLINALLNNKNLAKSSATPGKTKLVNFFESKWQCNSSLGMQFRTCGNFGDFADSKSSLNSPKRSFFENSHKHKSHTANTRIVDSNIADSSESSLRGRIVDSHEAIQKNQIDCHDSGECPNLAMTDTNHKISQKAEFAIHIIDFPGFGYAKVSKTERDSWDKNLSAFLKKRESIKLFIHLIDSRHTNLPLDDEIRAFLRSNLRADADILEVFTKADKLKKSEIHALKGKILVSVTKKDLGQRDFKDSIESLRHAILRTMYHI